jgi:hypothetical protein
MGTIKLMMYGWLSEQTALLAIFSSQPVWRRTFLFLIGHLIASALFALLLTGSFSKRFKASRAGLFAFFFSFNFFVPVLGALGTLLTMLYFIKFPNNAARTEFFNVPLPPFQVESASIPVGMGEGGAWSRLRSIALPRDQRLKALLAVGNSAGSNASRFMQLATGDIDDEIRLLAFNLSGRNEQLIQHITTTALGQLKDADSPVSRAALCRTLAFNYWEMIYNSMARDKLQNFYMEQAERYVRQALETGENTPELAILMIRIYLKKHDYQQAQHAIAEALALGVDRYKIMPYQAEIAFQKRDYAAIKQMIGQSPMVKFRPSIGPVAQFWGSR